MDLKSAETLLVPIHLIVTVSSAAVIHTGPLHKLLATFTSDIFLTFPTTNPKYLEISLPDQQDLLTSLQLNLVFSKAHAAKTCLNHVTNFKGININLGSAVPVILRRLEPALLSTTKSNKLENYLVWAPYQYYKPNETLSHQCSISSFYVDGNTHNHCHKLHLPAFIPKIKPWKCQIQIELFPPIFATHPEKLFQDFAGRPFDSPIQMLLFLNRVLDFGFPKIWSYNKIFDMTARLKEPLPPSTKIPTLKVMIPDKTILSLSEHEKSKLYLEWMHQVYVERLMTQQPFAHNSIFFEFTVTGIKQLLECPICTNNHGLLLKYIPSSEFISPFRKTFMDFLAFARQNNRMLFDISVDMYSQVSSDYNEFTAAMRGCAASWNSFGRNHMFWLVGANTKLALAQVHVLKSIMQNTSILIARAETKYCLNGKIHHFKDKSVDITKLPKLVFTTLLNLHRFNLPLQLSNSLQALHFISCGQYKVQTLSFTSLISVFDWMTWLLMLASCIILATTLYAITYSKHASFGIIETSLSLVKMFLEAGDPFSKRAIYSQSVKKHMVFIRVLIASALLSGVVLSNAYKNKNLSEMVSPRKIVLPTILDDLIKENYKIFTRSHHLKLSSLYRLEDTKNATEADLEGSLVKGYNSHYYNFKWRSSFNSEKPIEIMSELFFLKYQKDIFTTGVNISTLLNIRDPIKSFSQLIPLKVMREILFATKDKLQNDSLIKTSFVENMFFEFEEKQLSKVLQSCDSVAVILPNHLCSKYKQSLKPTTGKISISKEAFYETGMSFYFQGLVNPSIFLRIGSMSQSGIWEWWNRFITYMHLLSMRPPQFQKVFKSAITLSGNAQVIFYILLVGLVTSVLEFLLEWRVLMYLSRSSDTIKALVMKIGLRNKCKIIVIISEPEF